MAQCDVFQSQYCAPNGCCMRNQFDAGLGDCNVPCTPDATHPGALAGCRTNADCTDLRCWVLGNASACYASADLPTNATRFTCTSPGNCSGATNACLSDPTLPFITSCQCNPLNSACGAASVCIPSTGKCGSTPESDMGSGACPPPVGSACTDGSGCCHTSGSQGCQAPGACTGGILIGCTSSNDCAPLEYCSYDGPTTTKARCVRGIDWREACLSGGTGRNCAAGGACTGTVVTSVTGTVPRYCR